MPYKENWQKTFKLYCEERNKQFVTPTFDTGLAKLTEKIQEKELKRWRRMREDFEKRAIEIIHSQSKVNILHVEEGNTTVRIKYRLALNLDLKQGEQHYEQAWSENRLCLLKKAYKWWVIEDEVKEKEGYGILHPSLPADVDYVIRNPNERRPVYNREKAVEYAERWWDDYNPKFRKFEEDCTNFISQCLYAGGAPMKYSSDRAKGWWYRFDEGKWSFSWTVAHTFRWYLTTSQSGLRATEVFSADQLQIGDVICYDFEGDGKWQHLTMVVAKDALGMPLVNAHSTNSRHRYWEYKDSHAWTENIKYKFLRITDYF